MSSQFSNHALLSGLNKHQSQAVSHTSSPLLVLAGAGSGKTRVIVNKIAWLISEKITLPDFITAITFTNKAAQEMKDRVKEQLSELAKGVTVCTFHRLGLKILKEDCAQLGLRPSFSLIDQRDASVIVAELMRKDGDMDIKQAEAVHACISRWKNAALFPGQEKINFENPVEILASRVYEAYNDYLIACNSVDLDDLILLPLKILASATEIKEKWQYKIRYLLVDEYQDTNVAQYELVKILTQETLRLTVVGDDDQSVYTWRGADPKNLNKLKEDFPSLTVIQLQQNYRCTGRILKAANSLISNNPRMFDKELWTSGGYGPMVKVMGAKDEEHEASRIVTNIMHHNFVHENKFGDYAILYRSNHQSRIIEQKLRELKVPYYISGGMSFFDRSEIRDIVGYIRLLANLNDDAAFLRVANTPRRGIGASSLKNLAVVARRHDCSLSHAIKYVDQHDLHNVRQKGLLRAFSHFLNDKRYDIETKHIKPSQIVKDILFDIDYKTYIEENSSEPKQVERRLANVFELISWAEKMERSSKKGSDYDISDLIADLLLINVLENQDEFDAQKNQLALMTMHAAKGLEFNHVSIIGVEQGILPHQNSVNQDNIEEERRLFYVAMTRAKEDLVISYCEQRSRFGEKTDAQASSFLKELPQEDLQWTTPEDTQKKADKSTAKARIEQMREMLKND